MRKEEEMGEMGMQITTNCRLFLVLERVDMCCVCILGQCIVFVS